MFKPLRMLLNMMEEDGKMLNAEVFKRYGVDALTVWSEGGEWPMYVDEYARYKPGLSVVNFEEVEYVPAATSAQAIRIIEDSMDSVDPVGLTAECGAGKSTRWMVDLFNSKLAQRIVCVQPSSATARRVATYVSDSHSRVSAMHVRVAAEMPKTRVLAYVSAGCMVDMLLRGQVEATDLIVIDEAHMPTITHDFMMQLLSRYPVKTVMMTASTSYVVRAPRGVKLVEVPGFVTEVTESMASTRASAVVGVTDNQQYAVPAAALVGATLDLRLVYDTGLRPDPVVANGELAFGERQAQRIEIVQTVGRLGRLGKTGVGYYTLDAKALSVDGLRLYDVLLRAFTSAVGLSQHVPADKAIRVWRASGLIGSRPKSGVAAASTVGVGTPSTATLVGKPVGFDSGHLKVVTEKLLDPTFGTNEWRNNNSRDLDELGRLRDKFEDAQERLDDDNCGVRNRRSGTTGGVRPALVSVCSTPSLESVDSRGSSFRRYDLSNQVPSSYERKEYAVGERPRVVERRGCQNLRGKDLSSGDYDGEEQMTVRKVWKRDTVKAGWFGKKREIVSDPKYTFIIEKVVDGALTTNVTPDSSWRPFKRVDDRQLGENESLDVGMEWFVAKLIDAHSVGDYVEPCVLPWLDEKLVSWSDTNTAKAVLARKYPADYSESEVMAVIKGWNDMARSYAGRPADPVELDMYTTYFRKLASWNSN